MNYKQPKWKKGTVIEGVLREVLIGNWGKPQYIIETKKGHKTLVWGYFEVRERLSRYPIGSHVKIKFLSVKKSGKRRVFHFKISCQKVAQRLGRGRED
jgi:hypothetical protein